MATIDDLKLWSSQSPMCRQCIEEYQQLYSEGKIDHPFPVNCHGDARYIYGNPSKLPPEEAEVAAIMNPVIWSGFEFKDPENSNKEFELRYYQKDMICCTAQLKVYRCGRRIGKTYNLGVEAAHKCWTIPYYKVLFVAAYQSQVDLFFKILDNLTNNSRTLADIQVRKKLDPQTREYSNESVITGFCSGMNSGSSDKIMGQDANEIIIDEADLIEIESEKQTQKGKQKADVLGRVLAIMISRPEVRVRMSSTPRKHEGRFASACNEKERGWKEYHYTSMESPTWNARTEKQLRDELNDLEWDQEVLAEFGRTEGGVFPAEKLDQQTVPYKLINERRKDGCIYGIGVDWNEYPIGAHIVVVEYNWENVKFRMVDKMISCDKEFTQNKAIFDIITMFQKWDAAFIWGDAGHGNMQFESLHKFAVDNPNLRLMGKIRSCHMQEIEEVRDPFTNQVVKKQFKPLMVDLALRRIELSLCEYPEEESRKKMLVSQLKGMNIIRYTPAGVPVYSQGNDHTAIAYLIAMAGLILKFSDIKGIAAPPKVAIVRPSEENKRIVVPRAISGPFFGRGNQAGVYAATRGGIGNRRKQLSRGAIRRSI